MVQNKILKLATNYYLKSDDFNGLPIRELGLSIQQCKSKVAKLIKAEKLTINFDDNPHIKAFEPETIKDQLRKIRSKDIMQACIYPSKKYLIQVVDPAAYAGRPFTLKLALGEPQLTFYSFGLNVLGGYRDEAKYFYENDDVAGKIITMQKSDLSKEKADSDLVLLESFGFSYDSNMNRAIAVFLRYLKHLSPKHQQIWDAYMLKNIHILHPDYLKITIGDWNIGMSIFSAFLLEQHHINEICKLIDRCPIFKKEYYGEKKPEDFTFLIRPTLKEYNSFLHLLDKLISENINLEFFKNEVSLEIERQRSDGKIEVTHKGTITVLEEWLKKNRDKFSNTTLEDKMINTFRKIRKLRTNPAHVIDKNELNQEYFHLQRKLMIKAYEAMRTLRTILHSNTKIKSYTLPDELLSGNIWTF